MSKLPRACLVRIGGVTKFFINLDETKFSHTSSNLDVLYSISLTEKDIAEMTPQYFTYKIRTFVINCLYIGLFMQDSTLYYLYNGEASIVHMMNEPRNSSKRLITVNFINSSQKVEIYVDPPSASIQFNGESINRDDINEKAYTFANDYVDQLFKNGLGTYLTYYDVIPMFVKLHPDLDINPANLEGFMRLAAQPLV